MQKLILSLLVILNSLVITNAQSLQSPSDFLGYELGTKFSRHHQVIDYFKYIEAQMPNQVKLKKYGETYERRPLYVTYISSEENMRNLETIRQNNLKNAGILSGESNTQDIAIVWLSYNVHGNEASSTEAAMQTLYTLLTQKQDWLKNIVVIIDPCINPDGRDRYVNWYNTTASVPYDIDQQASEHNEPWPGGRPNHYLFDLNRDWAWASQIESQSRLKIYNKWMPQIHVDFHEQGINEPYYFAPAAEPYHEVISDWQRDFQTQIGKNHAKYFDKNGWLFFTRERFDLFYPSYGDTYPMYMGAIGMTYEQGGHSRGGLGVLNDEGEILTLVDRVRHHTTTGLSTVEMASKNAPKLNSEFHKFFNTSGLKYKSYVMQGDEDKIESLKTLLDRHEIKYENASKGKVSGYNYDTASQGSMTTTSNDLVVSTNQPKGKMVKALFEPDGKLTDSLTYDITAWSLPYANGLKSIASTSLVNSKQASAAAKVTAISNGYGYVSNWNSLKDAQFLADLLKQNFKVRFTEKPLYQNGKKYGRGSLIILKGDNYRLDDFYTLLNKTVLAHNQSLDAINSGFSDRIPDMGSPDIKLVNKQRIALLSGDGTSGLSYGALWYFFEQQLHYPVTSINTKHINFVNLSKYDVLIMPSGNYKNRLNEKAMDDLKSWIRKGGKVIAIDRALSTFAGKDGFGLKYNESKDAENKDKDKGNLIPYANKQREFAKQMITGAIFNTTVDNTHPMAFGYEDSYFTLKLGSTSYSLLDGGSNVTYIGEKPMRVSGFAGSEATKKLKNSLVFGVDRMRQGSVIYMVDNVTFRSFWENGKLFLINAIFFVNNNAFKL
jgi:hypothetical protein